MNYRFFLVILLVLLSIIFFDNSYNLKIEIPISNKNPIDIDENIAKNIEIELHKLNKLKDITLFSSIYGCNIYCKTKLFQNKSILINEIEQKLNLLNIKKYYINDKYNLKYQYFIVIQDKNNDYDSTKNKADKILEIVLKSNLVNDAKIIGTQQKANYIYFKKSDLLNYNLDLEDIKKIIKKNNVKENFILKNTNNSQFAINLNSTFKNIEDVKNISINYKNSNFSARFDDIFEIKKEIKSPPDSMIFFNKQNALVVVISKKIFYPSFILNFILRNEDVKIINPNAKRKIETILDENSSFENLYNVIKDKNGLFFLKSMPPKHNNQETFDEIKENRIIGFIDKNEKFNFKKEKLDSYPAKISSINYVIKNHKLNDFKLEKQELINTIQADSEGLVCDYYFCKNDKVEIILKNKNEDNFIYSKKLKTLVDKEMVVDLSYELLYSTIARKNFKNVTIKNSKTPLF